MKHLNYPKLKMVKIPKLYLEKLSKYQFKTSSNVQFAQCIVVVVCSIVYKCIECHRKRSAVHNNSEESTYKYMKFEPSINVPVLILMKMPVWQ